MIRFRDRETGEIRTEVVMGEKALRFLHVHPKGRKLTDLVLRHAAPNLLYGAWQNSGRSRKAIAEFVASLRIDAGEAEKPLEAYASLNEFFSRKLRAGARPIDLSPAHLVSPADGRVLVYPRVEQGRMTVKGCAVTLSELLGDAALARKYEGGAAVVVRLAPPDYHRFHFPEAGVAGEARKIGWHLYSVNPIALQAGAPSFKNKRQVTVLATKAFGELLLLEIGALGVGRIAQSYKAGAVARGQEKGYFKFGGSTVMIVTPPGSVTLDADLVEASREELETFVKMGTRIGCRGR